MLIGYARVSTGDQSLALLIDALEESGCKRVSQDQVNANTFEYTPMNGTGAHLINLIWESSSREEEHVSNRIIYAQLVSDILPNQVKDELAKASKETVAAAVQKAMSVSDFNHCTKECFESVTGNYFLNNEIFDITNWEQELHNCYIECENRQINPSIAVTTEFLLRYGVAMTIAFIL